MPPEMILMIVICFFAGMGAGLGTGFAGMSAAAVITPMLATFLGVDPYIAIGIALASDVLASGVSTIVYAKNKNIDIKNGSVMMVAVLLFTLLGSYLASLVPSTAMGGLSRIMTIFLGLRFIIKPVTEPKASMQNASKKKMITLSIVFGALVGLICGFFGAGGGIMMLLVLTSFLGFELKKAVGTSVFIMTFTALLGSVSHFVIAGEQPDYLMLGLCAAFTLIFSLIAAKIANKVKPKILNYITGGILIVISIAVLIFELI